MKRMLFYSSLILLAEILASSKSTFALNGMTFHLRDGASLRYDLPEIGPLEGGWFHVSPNGITYLGSEKSPLSITETAFESAILREAVEPDSGKIDTFLVHVGQLSQMDFGRFRENVEFRYEKDVKAFFTMTDADFRLQYAKTKLARHFERDKKSGLWHPKSRITDLFRLEYELTEEYFRVLQAQLKTTYENLDRKRKEQNRAFNKKLPEGAGAILIGSSQTANKDGVHEKIMKVVSKAGIIEKVAEAVQAKLLNSITNEGGHGKSGAYTFDPSSGQLAIDGDMEVPFGPDINKPTVILKLKTRLKGTVIPHRPRENERNPRVGENLLADLRLPGEIRDLSAEILSAEIINPETKSVTPWREAEGTRLRLAVGSEGALQVIVPHLRTAVPVGDNQYRVQISPLLETNVSELRAAAFEKDGLRYAGLQDAFKRQPKLFKPLISAVLTEDAIQQRLDAEADKLNKKAGTIPMDDYLLFDTTKRNKPLLFSTWLSMSPQSLTPDQYQALPEASRRGLLSEFKESISLPNRAYNICARLQVILGNGQAGPIKIQRITPDESRDSGGLDLGGFRVLKEDNGFEIRLSEFLYRLPADPEPITTGEQEVSIRFKPMHNKMITLSDETRLQLVDGRVVVKFNKEDTKLDVREKAYVSDITVRDKKSTLTVTRQPGEAFKFEPVLFRSSTAVPWLQSYFNESKQGMAALDKIKGTVARAIGMWTADYVDLNIVPKWDPTNVFRANLKVRSESGISKQSLSFVDQKELLADPTKREAIRRIEESGKTYLGTMRYRIDFDTSAVNVELAGVKYSGDKIFVSDLPTLRIFGFDLLGPLGLKTRVNITADKINFTLSGESGKNFYVVMESALFRDPSTGAIKLQELGGGLKGNLLDAANLVVSDWKIDGLRLFQLNLTKDLEKRLIESIKMGIEKDKPVLVTRLLMKLREILDPEFIRISAQATNAGVAITQGMSTIQELLDSAPELSDQLGEDAVLMIKEQQLLGKLRDGNQELKLEPLQTVINSQLDEIFRKVGDVEQNLGREVYLPTMIELSKLMRRVLPEINGHTLWSWGEAALLEFVLSELGPSTRKRFNGDSLLAYSYLAHTLVPKMLSELNRQVVIPGLSGTKRRQAIHDTIVRHGEFATIEPAKIDEWVSALDHGLELGQDRNPMGGRTLEAVALNDRIQSAVRQLVPGIFFGSDYTARVAGEQKEALDRRAVEALLRSPDFYFSRMTFINGCPTFVWRSDGAIREQSTAEDLALLVPRQDASVDFKAVVPQDTVSQLVEHVFRQISIEEVPYLFAKNEKKIRDNFGLTDADEVVMTRGELRGDALEVEFLINQRSAGISKLLQLLPHIALSGSYLFFSAFPGKVQRLGEEMTAGIDQGLASRFPISIGASGIAVEYKEVPPQKPGEKSKIQLAINIKHFKATTEGDTSRLGNAFSVFISKLLTDVLNSEKTRDEVLAKLKEKLKVNADKDVIDAIFARGTQAYDSETGLYRIGFDLSDGLYNRLGTINSAEIANAIQSGSGLGEPLSETASSDLPGKPLDSFFDQPE